jgi:uncharacterized protein YdaU (DUF1376 family)
MAEFPSLPMFVDAYMADTGDLTDSEHGAYHLLLYVAWLRPDNGLPNDMDWLKRALGAHCSNMHGNHFAKVIPRLLTRFWSLDLSTGSPGVWRQKRLEKERDFLRKRSTKQSENINKRWSRNNENNDLAQTTVVPSLYPPPHPPVPVSTESSSSSPSTASARDQTNPQNPHGNGYRDGTVTIEDPANRLAIFQRTIAQRLGPSGYDIVTAATDANSPEHARSLALCKAAAKALGKGWPRQWLITPASRAPPKR